MVVAVAAVVAAVAALVVAQVRFALGLDRRWFHKDLGFHLVGIELPQLRFD